MCRQAHTVSGIKGKPTNSEVIGTVSNLREVYQIKNEYFPVWSPNATLSIRETYTYAGTETSTDALHAAFHRIAGTTRPV